MKDILSLFRRRKIIEPQSAKLAFRKKSVLNPNNSLRNEWYAYESRSGFYRYLRDRIPIISSAIWHWVRLCNTPGNYNLIGRDSHRREAKEVINSLLDRINTVQGVKSAGLGSLLELFFLEIFTNGGFCGKIIPQPSGSGVDYFHDMDCDEIEWVRKGRWIPHIKKDETLVPLDPGLFFHYGLNADSANPRGVSFLASVEFVTIIEQRMVEDMARSAHNAGSPHLHIRINPPERYEHESDSQYLSRSEDYFNNSVKIFQEIDPDDNIFSWSDLEVTIVGGSKALPYAWRLNREQVIEDVITGMKLFPWVVGRTHGATKNWAQAQFNLLMQVVDSIQVEGKAFAEWIVNMELKLKNIPVKAEYIFNPNQDPYQLEREKTAGLKFDTVDKKVRRGYISKEDGAIELGYHGAFSID